MKKLAYIALVIMLLLPSCAPAAKLPTIIVAVTETAMPPPTSTKTPLVTVTKHPSATPIDFVPTKTITPMAVFPVTAHPLTLTQFNAGIEMKRLNVIGTGTAHDLEFSPDGKRLAVATGRGIFLYDGTTFEQKGFIDVDDSVSAIAFSPDGNVLAVAVDGKVSLWNVISGQQMMNLAGELVSIYKLAYGLGGYVAAVGGTCRGCGSQQIGMKLWDAETGRQIFSQSDIWYATKALAFKSDGKQLFFGGQNGLTIIETETGRIVELDISKFGFPSAARMPGDFVFNNEGTKLFVTSLGEDGDVVDVVSQTRQPFTLCDTNLASSMLYGACPKGQVVMIFNLSDGEEIETIDVGTYLDGWNAMFTLSPDSRYLAYGIEHFVSIIDTKTGQLLRKLEFTNFDNLTAGLALFGGTEKYVGAVENPPGQISLFDLQSGESLSTFSLECCEITGFAFSPDRKTGATVSKNILHLWDISSSQIIYEKKLDGDFFSPMVFSPDASKIFLAHASQEYILRFDLYTQEMETLGKNYYAYHYADPFAADNFHFNELGNLVVLEYDHNIGEQHPTFRDIVTNKVISIPYNVVADSEFLESFAINPAGQFLIIGNATGIYVWDLHTQRQLYYFNQHEWRGGDGWIGAIKSLIFNPKTDLLVSVGWDQTTRLWNIHTGNQLRILNVCCSASFTPDGRYLVTAGDGVMRVWGIP
jgi:WD40 repeat protein